MSLLFDKVALVTGASRGVGYAAARKLCEKFPGNFSRKPRIIDIDSNTVSRSHDISGHQEPGDHTRTESEDEAGLP